MSSELPLAEAPRVLAYYDGARRGLAYAEGG